MTLETFRIIKIASIRNHFVLLVKRYREIKHCNLKEAVAAIKGNCYTNGQIDFDKTLNFFQYKV
jgi:hypothetical protein